jgi:hypothetical protein
MFDNPKPLTHANWSKPCRISSHGWLRSRPEIIDRHDARKEPLSLDRLQWHSAASNEIQRVRIG